MPKVILPESVSGRRGLLGFSDARWARIRNAIPEPLSAEADARMRSAVTACCSWFLSQQARLEEGVANAAAMRGSRKQPAPLERLAKGLRSAADAWATIGKIHDDHLGDMERYATLAAMAGDAERRLKAFRKLGAPITMEGPWPEFVRKVARCCRTAGLNPTATGRIYERGRPTWFQEFMASLDKDLLGSHGLIRLDQKSDQFERDHRAFYAEVAKALRGDKKAGTPRK